MTDTTPARTEIIGGVDTHQDLHTAAIVTLDGAVLGTESFSTTRAGYRAMLRGSCLTASCFASASSPRDRTEPESPVTWRWPVCRCWR